MARATKRKETAHAEEAPMSYSEAKARLLLALQAAIGPP